MPAETEAQSPVMDLHSMQGLYPPSMSPSIRLQDHHRHIERRTVPPQTTPPHQVHLQAVKGLRLPSGLLLLT